MPPKALARLRLAFGVLGLGAVGLQLVIQVERGYSVVNFFSYFTNLSNVFAAGVLIAGAGALRRAGVREPADFVRGLSVVNMVVVGLVYAALLRHVNVGPLRPTINFVLHDVMPVVVLIDWAMAPPRRALGRGFVPACLVVPTLYLVYVLVRGRVVDWYPYPFLDPDRHESGYAGVAAYAAGIGLAFAVVAWLVRASGAWLRSRLAGTR